MKAYKVKCNCGFDGIVKKNKRCIECNEKIKTTDKPIYVGVYTKRIDIMIILLLIVSPLMFFILTATSGLFYGLVGAVICAFSFIACKIVMMMKTKGAFEALVQYAIDHLVKNGESYGVNFPEIDEIKERRRCLEIHKVKCDCGFSGFIQKDQKCPICDTIIENHETTIWLHITVDYGASVLLLPLFGIVFVAFGIVSNIYIIGVVSGLVFALVEYFFIIHKRKGMKNKAIAKLALYDVENPLENETRFETFI